MARTTPPTITPAPLPAPQRGDRATFSNRVDAFVLWLTTAVAQFGAVATNVYNNAVDAFASATSAGNSAAAAALSATSADRDAQTATMAPGTSATSVTSMVLGLGSKTFTLAQTGKLFKKGNTVTIATSAAGNNWMSGPITAFDSGTGVMTVNVTNFTGSGTFADWVVSLSGAAGLTGVVNELLASNIASAATVNLTNATGNLVHITGATTISAFTLTPGAERSVVFDGALTLTNSAGLLLPGGANIVTAAGDRALIRGDSNGAIVTHYQRASGLAIRSGALDLIMPATNISTAVANIDFLSFVTGDYDKYFIEIQGLKLSAVASLQIQFAVGGTLDTASSYRNGNALATSFNSGQSYPANDALGANVSLEIKNSNSSNLKSLNYVSTGLNSGGSYASVSSESSYIGTSPISGIRLMSTGANITQATIRIYGLKNTL